MKDAQSIDEVIEKLQKLIDTAIKEESRTGYFISLYCMVTMAVRDAIYAKRFHDNERMHKLDVIFANYFFKNSTYHNTVWFSFFSARNISSYVISQHLLLGMNAHINYDLAQAVVDTKEPLTKEYLEDYLLINEILYQQVDKIQDKLAKSSFFIRLFDLLGLGFDESYVDFSMIKARNEAWANAVKLSQMNQKEKEIYLHKMRLRTLKFARNIKKPTFLYKLFYIINKLCEKNSIKNNLLALKP